MTEPTVLRTPRARRYVGRLRLVAQRLVPATASSPAEAVQHMTCLQAQDFRSGRSAVALRSGCAVGDVDAALNAGDIVRSWPMRGTLHLVAATDLRWMLALNGESILHSARRRHSELGITAQDIETARMAAEERLRGGRGVDRPGLFAHWEAHGIATAGQRGAHLLQALCLRAHLVLGPIVGRQQQFVLFDEWIRTSEPVDRAANIADWARRYFRSHGPATVADFRWWSGVLQRDLAPVWDAVRADLVELVVDGTAYFVAPETIAAWEEHDAATLRPQLTPAFDEILLGYADRTPTLDKQHMEQVVPGGNGMFKAALLDGGAAVATWRRKPVKSIVAVDVSSFDGALSKRAERALPGLARRYPFAP
ncbi:winged helix DNA-binding domain-containing protein [Flexivirga alba]|uniref:Winged helix DNA-binding domain-containing protein n=1 Tax=Flexivirga alba TaxID=702742 RepID=A0ABW2AHX2_9MICO